MNLELIIIALKFCRVVEFLMFFVLYYAFRDMRLNLLIEKLTFAGLSIECCCLNLHGVKT